MKITCTRKFYWKLSAEETWGYIGVLKELSKYQLDNIRGIELVYSRKYTKSNHSVPLLIITTYKGKGQIAVKNTGTESYRPWAITRPKKILFSKV